eukprot:12759942-Alexandrium_andersonii.AAC.1
MQIQRIGVGVVLHPMQQLPLLYWLKVAAEKEQHTHTCASSVSVLVRGPQIQSRAGSAHWR